MIRYAIRQVELKRRIRDHVADWLERARKRTVELTAIGEFDETDLEPKEFWTELKPFYLTLQRYKCGYCERLLSAKERGIKELRTVESDLEHYRPKKKVQIWPSKDIRNKYRIPAEIKSGDSFDQGYYLLAYNHLNYLVSCRKCNKVKHTFFPVAGSRFIQPGNSLQDYQQEKPYLVFPIGSLDVNPQDLITFEGIRPVPRKKKGLARLRGLATIHLLRLDIREELLRGRAEA